MIDDELLDELACALHDIERLVDRGRAEYDAEESLRRSIHRIWIFAGNCAQAYAERHRLPRGPI